jgi:transglutaminase superfamily protein
VTRVGIALGAVRARRWSEIWDVAEAQLALLRAQALRWLRPLGEFVEVTPAEALQLARASSAQRQTCERLASAINRATRYGLFRPLCLTRAVALSRMLEAHGIGGHTIRIGVRREGGCFTAHAWVELGNRVLGDTVANTLSYAPLTQVSVAGDPVLSGIARHRLHRGPRHPGDRLEWDQ